MTALSQHTAKASTPGYQPRLARGVVVGAGLLLIAAGVLKLVQFIQGSETHVTLSDRFALPLSIFEAWIGGMVIWYRAHRVTAMITLVCFSTFAGYAAYRWFAGFADCGCFGILKVPPVFTVIIDLSIIVFLALCIDTHRLGSLWPIPLAAIGALGLGSGIALADLALARQCVVKLDDVVGATVVPPAGIDRIILYDPSCARCGCLDRIDLPANVLKLEYGTAGFKHGHLTLNNKGDFCQIFATGPVILSIPGKRVDVVSPINRQNLSQILGGVQ